MRRFHRSLLVSVVVTAAAAAIVTPAVADSPDPAPRDPMAPPGMARMHELMTQGNPGMARMHELMAQGTPGMERMHELMMRGTPPSAHGSR